MSPTQVNLVWLRLNWFWLTLLIPSGKSDVEGISSLPHSRFAWLSLGCFGELCSSAFVFLPSEADSDLVTCSQWAAPAVWGGGLLSAWCPSPWQHPQSSCPFPGMLRSKREPTPRPYLFTFGRNQSDKFSFRFSTQSHKICFALLGFHFSIKATPLAIVMSYFH